MTNMKGSSGVLETNRTIVDKKITLEHTHRHGKALRTHKQDSGNHDCASQWDLRGEHRGQSTAWLWVCVYPIINSDKRHKPCHHLSPLPLLPLLFLPFIHFPSDSFKLFSCTFALVVLCYPSQPTPNSVNSLSTSPRAD